MIELSSSAPLHVQAANYMREKIYNHEWVTDEQIPTEFELAEQLGMSRGTVRRAIKSLVEEGLLIQVQGRGTFVTQSDIVHPSGTCLISFAESLRSQGIAFTTEVVREEVSRANAFIAGKLLVPEGSRVLFLDRVRSVEGEPIMYIESAINLEVLPGLELVDFNSETLFATIEKRYGRRIGHSNARFAAMVAGEKRGHILGVETTAPVLHIEQQIFFTDNTPVEWSNVWLRASRYVVSTLMQRV